MSDNPEPAPLAKRRVLVTRARHQAGRLTAALQALGATVLEIPTVEIAPPDSYEPLDRALRNLARYRWLIVTSANTVQALAERLARLGIGRSAFAHLSIVAIGSATASTLRTLGLTVDLVPEQYVAESLVAALEDQVAGARILLARAAIARDIIPDELRRRGATVDIVDAYQTSVPAASVTALRAAFAFRGSAPDAVTFTSSSTVHNFLKLLRQAGFETVPHPMRAISIGPITSATLREYDWEPTAEANPSNIDGLVDATLAALTASKPAN